MKITIPFSTEERKAVLSFSSLLFLVVCSLVILKTVRDGLFLSRYPSSMLPYFMAFNTLVSALAAMLFLRLYKRFSVSGLVRATLFLFGLGCVMMWFLWSYRFLPGLLFLWVGIIGTIAPVQAWMVVSQRLIKRQARRLMGLVGAGAILGSMIGGFAARTLVTRIGVFALLPISGVLFGLACLVAGRLSSVENPRPEIAAPASREDSMVRPRFVILLLAVVAISTVVSSLIDFQFKILAQHEHHHANTLAHFFGSFYAATGALTLLMQLVATPYLMRRFGIPATLPMLPGLLSITNLAFLFTGSFGSALTVRGTDEVARYSLDRSSLEVLYVALPENRKVRLKALIDTIGVRVPEGLAALMLVTLFSVGHLPLTLIAEINAGLLLVWLVCAALLGFREYPQMLKQEIQRKEIDFDEVKENLFSHDFFRLLPIIFRNAEKDTILGILQLMDASGKKWLGACLWIACQHPDPEIRLAALRCCFHQNTNLSQQMAQLLEDNERWIRVEAVHYICSRSKSKQKLLQRFANDKDLAVQAALCAVPASRIGAAPKAIIDLEKILDAAFQPSQPDARIEVAHVLEFLPVSEASVRLYERLLADPSLDVRRAAIRCVANTRPAGVISSLLNLSRQPALLSDVRYALSKYGDLLILHLTQLMEDPKESVRHKKNGLKIAADVGGMRCLQLALKMASDKNVALRFSAIKALNRMKRDHALAPSENSTVQLLEAEIEDLTWEITRSRAFAPIPDGVLQGIVSQRMEWGFERAFRLLALLHSSETIYSIYRAWISGQHLRRDTAIELLEQVESTVGHRQLSPLLETYQHPGPTNAESITRGDAFSSYLSEDEPALGAAAIHELTNDELRQWVPENQIDRFHRIVQETLAWRYAQMENQKLSEGHETLTTIHKMEKLSKVNLFSRLGTQELLLITEQAEDVTFEPGETIFQEGDPATEFYILLSGSVATSLDSHEIAIFREGECFGIRDLLAGQPRYFSATVLTPCRCLKVSGDLLWEVLEDYSSVSQGIIQVLAQEVQTLTEKLAEKSPSPVPVF